MKKAIRLFAVMAMIISASFVNASETTFTAELVGEMKFRVVVSDIRGTSSAYIRDANGNILYKKQSNEGLLRKTFDFSRLDMGTYEIVVKDEAKVRMLPIAITENGVEFDQAELEKFYFPVVEENEDVVVVKLLSDEGNDLSVNISSRSGELLASEKIEGKLGLIGRKYHFNPGQYAITVRSNDFIETQYITIR